MFPVKYISDPAAHACREVLAGHAQNHGPSACHVLKTMVSAALCHRCRAGVSHTETLACDTADISLAGGRSIESHIADDHIFMGNEPGAVRRRQDQFASRKPLPETIVRVSLQAERNSGWQECSERLSAASGAVYCK